MDLRSSEGWSAMEKMADQHGDELADDLFRGTSFEEYHYIRGQVEGMRWIVRAVNKIIENPDFWADKMGEDNV